MEPGKKLRNIFEFLGIGLGCLVTAAGLAFFLVPNKIAAGGVSGFATVVFHLYGFPVGMTMLVLNIPLFIFGVRALGFSFGIKSFYGMVLLSVFIDLMELGTVPLTGDPLLAGLYGGILVGVGLAIVFRFGGTTGGTTLAAQLLRARLKQVTTGQSLLIIDFLVILLAGFVFNIELALYALISIFVTSKAIDVVQEGLGYAKACFIISDQAEQIAREIVSRLDRGGTILPGYGIYSGKSRNVLMSVVGRAELSRLKELVYRNDPRAFVIVTDANEALGEGFKELELK